MKLSFSTKGWHGRSFDALCDMAEATGFSGIELHNINGPLFTDRDGAFFGRAAAATKRRLYDRKLSIPCLDVLSDPVTTPFDAAKDLPCQPLVEKESFIVRFPHIRSC